MCVLQGILEECPERNNAGQVIKISLETLLSRAGSISNIIACFFLSSLFKVLAHMLTILIHLFVQ